jgi:small subunit ribosomal protein S21
MPKVTARSNESQQSMFRRFRKVVTRSGVLSEVRKKRWFISKSEQRRMDKKKAIRRHRRNQMKFSNGRKPKGRSRS